MPTIQQLFPDAEMLLAMPVVDLAPTLLRLAKDRIQNGMFWPQSVTDARIGDQNGDYSFHNKQKLAILFSQTWEWLRQNSLIIPAPDINGRNGWMMLTAKGEAIGDAQDFKRLQAAIAFPKDLLHPSIAEKTWLALTRGDLDEAVFAAFKAVEVAVRTAGGFAATDVGVPLMRKAFDKATGPLSDPTHPEAEREALAHLFAGAIGSHKNPHSHRTVNLTELREAQEQVLLASHLLSIVDARTP